MEKEIKLLNNIGASIFIEHFETEHVTLVLTEGQRIFFYDARHLVEQVMTKPIYHNQNCDNDFIHNLALSGCKRILISFDTDKINIWDVRRYEKKTKEVKDANIKAFTWTYFANARLQCDKILTTNDMCIFMPAVGDPEN